MSVEIKDALPKSVPLPDPVETNEMNFRVLKRIDPTISNIIFTSGHVVVYALDKLTQKWSEKHVKGPIFLVKRNSTPKYMFVVFNRLSTATVVEPVYNDMKIENNGDYVFYESQTGEINGLWFYNKEERSKFCATISKLKNMSSADDNPAKDKQSNENPKKNGTKNGQHYKPKKEESKPTNDSDSVLIPVESEKSSIIEQLPQPSVQDFLPRTLSSNEVDPISKLAPIFGPKLSLSGGIPVPKSLEEIEKDQLSKSSETISQSTEIPGTGALLNGGNMFLYPQYFYGPNAGITPYMPIHTQAQSGIHPFPFMNQQPFDPANNQAASLKSSIELLRDSEANTKTFNISFNPVDGTIKGNTNNNNNNDSNSNNKNDSEVTSHLTQPKKSNNNIPIIQNFNLKPLNNVEVTHQNNNIKTNGQQEKARQQQQPKLLTKEQFQKSLMKLMKTPTFIDMVYKHYVDSMQPEPINNNNNIPTSDINNNGIHD
eukprot:TRINITY_DN560_c0_g2_i3.p1 TRINITY_DN560_c0_g2~~TRINITY_DN560_c0_g2_i3.p1  ORF type:complete len:485 (-),score=117.73 TRINITY_DN560_c0_g2_i3:877-2331(-)